MQIKVYIIYERYEICLCMYICIYVYVCKHYICKNSIHTEIQYQTQ